MEQDILEFAEKLNCKELHMVVDESVGLKAVIAIHSTLLGPALGGCRLIEYPSTTSAVIDAIRLAQGMTYKAAVSNLPLGGGKMVVLKPKVIKDRISYFKAIGRFVDKLNGRYITAVDSGTSVEDMDIIASVTEHVTSTSKSIFTRPDPSGMTADGVIRGIEAAVHYKLKRDNLKDLRVAIQGLGHAGYPLAKQLHEKGAKLIVFDVRQELVQRAVTEFQAQAVSDFDTLLKTPSDVFAPCALGGIINDETIPKLNTTIIAGCANNQLEDPRHCILLKQKGILYAPDNVINAGGLIYVAAQFSHITEVEAVQHIHAIYDTLIEIFKRSDKENRGTQEIADNMAKDKLTLSAKQKDKEIVEQ